MFVFGLLAAAIWSIVGFVFWIPFLVRAIAIYCLSVTGAAITGQSTKGLGNILHEATTFYARGFKRIFESFQDEDPKSPREPLGVQKIALECIWTIFFWTTTIVFSLWMHGNLYLDANGLKFTKPFRENVYSNISSPVPSPTVKEYFLVTIENKTPYEISYIPIQNGQEDVPVRIKPHSSDRWIAHTSQTKMRFDPAMKARVEQQIVNLQNLRVVDDPNDPEQWRDAPVYQIIFTNDGRLMVASRE